MTFNPLEHPVCLEFPHWLKETAWAEHIPFAMYLISAAKPRRFVELGAYRGVSYCAFCQAVKATGAPTECYAVDTWQGDEHAGRLDENVFRELELYHNPLYGEFSRLVKSSFDDALTHFADNSLDLLHIDGFHTFEAVKHDFETWLPKMSARGIILFHDTNVRESDFGVWKFWREVSVSRPHFEFLHGHGLGVLAVGEEIPAGLQNFFAADERETVLIRSFFTQFGGRIQAVKDFQNQSETVDYLRNFERFVNSSKTVRAYRKLHQSLWRKQLNEK